MDKASIVRAWKDPDFRTRLSTEQRAELPKNPAGQSMHALEEDVLDSVAGGRPPHTARKWCQGSTENSYCTAVTVCACDDTHDGFHTVRLC
jgi:mersacidin/lichenicidin family type 2 lantibiotic